MGNTKNYKPYLHINNSLFWMNENKQSHFSLIFFKFILLTGTCTLINYCLPFYEIRLFKTLRTDRVNRRFHYHCNCESFRKLYLWFLRSPSFYTQLLLKKQKLLISIWDEWSKILYMFVTSVYRKCPHAAELHAWFIININKWRQLEN